MQKQTTQLQTRNGEFRVSIIGQDNNPVLMLSNSLGTTLEMWEGQIPALSKKYKIIRYDTRGHGKSTAPSGSYTFDELGDDALAILDALKIEKTLFCGISMGGHTALWLGINAPQKLNGIIVCNSAAKIGEKAAWQERANNIRTGGKTFMKELSQSAPSRWFTPTYIKEKPQKVQWAQEMIAQTPPAGYAACCDALGESDLRGQIEKINVPTLIIAGEYDPVTTVADGLQMQEKIKNAQLEKLSASHLSNIEARQAFDAAVLNFQ